MSEKENGLETDWFIVTTLVFGFFLLALGVIFYNPIVTVEYTVSVQGEPINNTTVSSENVLTEENQSAHQRKVIQNSLGSENKIDPSSDNNKQELQELSNFSYVETGSVIYPLQVSETEVEKFSGLTLFSFIGGLILVIVSMPPLIKQFLTKAEAYLNNRD